MSLETMIEEASVRARNLASKALIEANYPDLEYLADMLIKLTYASSFDFTDYKTLDIAKMTNRKELDHLILSNRFEEAKDIIDILRCLQEIDDVLPILDVMK